MRQLKKVPRYLSYLPIAIFAVEYTFSPGEEEKIGEIIRFGRLAPPTPIHLGTFSIPKYALLNDTFTYHCTKIRAYTDYFPYLADFGLPFLG